MRAIFSVGCQRRSFFGRGEVEREELEAGASIR
jgi:hypothetical protein